MTQKEKVLKLLRKGFTKQSIKQSVVYLRWQCFGGNGKFPPEASIRRAIGELRRDGHKITYINGSYKLTR